MSGSSEARAEARKLMRARLRAAEAARQLGKHELAREFLAGKRDADLAKQAAERKPAAS